MFSSLAMAVWISMLSSGSLGIPTNTTRPPRRATAIERLIVSRAAAASNTTSTPRPRSHEDRTHAVVVMSGPAEFAMAAGDGRLHGDALAHVNRVHSFADSGDFSGGLMAQYGRVSGARGADAALLVPVHVAAANP